MKLSLLQPSTMFSVAELSAMELDFEILRYFEVYALFGFLETSETRAYYLRASRNKKERKKTATDRWVQMGGLRPSQLELVDLREPLRKH
jgi:hypothetical protein